MKLKTKEIVIYHLHIHLIFKAILYQKIFEANIAEFG